MSMQQDTKLTNPTFPFSTINIESFANFRSARVAEVFGKSNSFGGKVFPNFMMKLRGFSTVAFEPTNAFSCYNENTFETTHFFYINLPQLCMSGQTIGKADFHQENEI